MSVETSHKILGMKIDWDFNFDSLSEIYERISRLVAWELGNVMNLSPESLLEKRDSKRSFCHFYPFNSFLIPVTKLISNIDRVEINVTGAHTTLFRSMHSVESSIR